MWTSALSALVASDTPAPLNPKQNPSQRVWVVRKTHMLSGSVPSVHYPAVGLLLSVQRVLVQATVNVLLSKGTVWIRLKIEHLNKSFSQYIKERLKERN